MTATRGVSNKNDRGSSYDVRRRKEWMLETYRAEVDVALPALALNLIGTTMARLLKGMLEHNRKHQTFTEVVPQGEGQKACRCYRCGLLLTYATLTVDRIIPKCKGGSYRRNNIRPACGLCNSETGGAMARGREHQAAKKIRKKAA